MKVAPPKYTDEEYDFLRSHYNTAPKAEIMAVVRNRTWNAIMQQAHKLGLNERLGAVPADQRWVWGVERTAILVAHYPTGGYRAVLAALEKAGLMLPTMCRLQINNQAHKIKVKMLVPVKEAPAPKLVAPKRAPIQKVSVERIYLVPVLMAQKAKRRLTDKQARAKVVITADEIKKLSIHHEGRKLYTLYACAGWTTWLNQQNAPAA